jgi:hypothetical protein
LPLGWFPAPGTLVRRLVAWPLRLACGIALLFLTVVLVRGLDARKRGEMRRGHTVAPFHRERAAAFGDVFALARRDLVTAGEYVSALQRAGAPRGFVEFTALPSELAWASLDRVEAAGPGSKVSRPEVLRITRRVRHALDRDECPVTTPAETR